MRDKDLTIERIYDVNRRAAGVRILVDRLWPRGVSKEAARIDLWLKDIAPSGALRKWFGHDPAKWDEFRRRYFEELDANPQVVAQLLEHVDRGPVVLVYAAKDTTHNDAVALKQYIESRRDIEAGENTS